MNKLEFKKAINDFFSTEEMEFYWIEGGLDFDKSLMAQEFNENNESGCIIPTDEDGYPDMDSEEINVLHEWMTENNWNTIDE